MKLKLTQNEFLVALNVNDRLLRDKRNGKNYEATYESNLDHIVLTLQPCNDHSPNSSLMVNEKELNKYYKFSSGLDFKIKGGK